MDPGSQTAPPQNLPDGAKRGLSADQKRYAIIGVGVLVAFFVVSALPSSLQMLVGLALALSAGGQAAQLYARRDLKNVDVSELSRNHSHLITHHTFVAPSVRQPSGDKGVDFRSVLSKPAWNRIAPGILIIRAEGLAFGTDDQPPVLWRRADLRNVELVLGTLRMWMVKVDDGEQQQLFAVGREASELADALRILGYR